MKHDYSPFEGSPTTMAATARASEELIYPLIVEQIRGRMLTAVEIGKITGVSERQVHRWSTGASRPEGASRSRLLELNYVVQLLREVYTNEGAEIWLHGPNRNFEGRKPIEVLETDDFRKVLREIDRLAEGTPS